MPDDETEPTEPEDDGTEPTEPEDDGTDPTEPETEEDETETEGCAHSYELVESREADCCFSGFDLYVCTSCGENLHENVVPPTGEHEGYYEEVVGCITYTRCVSTGERFKITGEHNYIDIGYMPPNCVAPGGYWVECTVCGERMVALEGYEEPLGHEYQTTVIPPTCMSEGYTLVECVNCHDSWAEKIVPSTDHGSEVVEVVPPTQTSEGYTVYQCPGCGHTWYDDFTAPLS